MKLENDPATEVFINENGGITIKQPEEPCLHCGDVDTAYIVFSSQRARVIAEELYRLARQIESVEREDHG
jgi:hypothetical protein